MSSATATCCYSASTSDRHRDLVIATVEEFDQAQAMPERVRQPCDFAPDFNPNLLLDLGTSADCSGQRAIDVVHDDVQVEGCPVPFVAAAATGCGRSSSSLFEQPYGRRPSRQLRSLFTKAPPDCQAERLRVERDCLFKIGDVNIHQHRHGGTGLPSVRSGKPSETESSVASAG